MKHDWNIFGGGEPPVDEGTYIEVRYRDGGTDMGYVCNYDWEWRDDDADNDIVAYRIVDGAVQ